MRSSIDLRSQQFPPLSIRNSRGRARNYSNAFSRFETTKGRRMLRCIFNARCLHNREATTVVADGHWQGCQFTANASPLPRPSLLLPTTPPVLLLLLPHRSPFYLLLAQKASQQSNTHGRAEPYSSTGLTPLAKKEQGSVCVYDVTFVYRSTGE